MTRRDPQAAEHDDHEDKCRVAKALGLDHRTDIDAAQHLGQGTVQADPAGQAGYQASRIRSGSSCVDGLSGSAAISEANLRVAVVPGN